MVLDLDDFKGFKDSRGHQAGDRLLRSAAAWQAVLRNADTIAAMVRSFARTDVQRGGRE